MKEVLVVQGNSSNPDTSWTDSTLTPVNNTYAHGMQGMYRKQV